MNVFEFETNAESAAYCDQVVDAITRLFGVQRDEAIGRVNRQWKGLSFIRDEDMIYHETPDFWAKSIFYEPDVHWWIPGEELRVKPYP